MKNDPRCAYEHVYRDTTDEQVDAKEGPTVWQCPHPASGATEYCLFHAPIEGKNAEAVTESLLDVVNDPTRPSVFIGGKFETLGLASADLESEEPIDLRGAMIHHNCDLRDATVDAPLRLDGVSVGGAMCMQRFEARSTVSCRGLQVGGRWALCEATVDGRLDATDFSTESLIATDAHFVRGATFRRGTVEAQFAAARATFDGPTWLSHTRVGGHLDLGNVTCTHRLSLAHCHVDEHVNIQSATVDDGISLDHLHVGHEFDATRLTVTGGIDATTGQFDGTVDCTGLTVTDGRVDFGHCTFEGPVYFDGATISGRKLRFHDAQFESGTVSFVRTAISGNLDLSGVTCSTTATVRVVEGSVGGSIICDHATFEDELFFSNVRVKRDFDFSDCTVGTLTFGVEVDGRLDFAYTHVTDSAEFRATIIHGPARFTSAQFDTDPSLTDATLDGTVAAYNLSVESPDQS
ncbi:hypothetical protein E6P09_01100 [Haloferax mediterranei ATCC 33500]|uniref:Pentapeptide repeat-containing protein n=1 Tax=Haloferax mediterranei (strain ATCC 33500 / DSM 1411 / JCM 8866 / NBRC 14739 / NCIMB 2177 / R-4) TaxID=523841 RepID=I3R6E9_HALMT|nr:pentapeptide repeat-containing protein [Haloferax mediterranei]AFK19809.1 pentapeptide repeat-containing protein [Haloferax mediterranei ATCC 33500]AHZ23193.1 hypothetical protein BM92_11340 [Haloferax mediterranei ATCC 33500]ELZ99771.1 pentapeptide repeat-containing protein [Haloferax mediterranei ATCC 33500]MDX5987444.1 pentapeptide repeat-containing protein [Haloferax mediterranei ATCC 33500]QCQ73946.1 hypothetical protein E6P09_01100 [Haloferax mediterranei ATCC 33500]